MSVLRITEPDYTNRYYRHVSSGGVNECIRVMVLHACRTVLAMHGVPGMK